MTKSQNAIPRPLVRANQWLIVITISISLLTKQPYWILFPILITFGGIAFQKNIVIMIGKHFLTHPSSFYLLEDKRNLRFNQGIAFTLLTVSLTSYFLHYNLLAITLQFIVLLAALIAILGFCLGCYLRFKVRMLIYRYLHK